MARYKYKDPSQGLFLSVNLREQLIPGTFEFALNQIMDKDIDLSPFDLFFKNDDMGAPAFKPGILLKIILYSYSKGIISSRAIADACKTNIIVKALAEDCEPHFTTIAHFISSLSLQINHLFSEVLLICSELKLIEGSLFAIDGCKLSSQASKEYSGTFEDLQKKQEKLERMVGELLELHKARDQSESPCEEDASVQQKIDQISAKAKSIKEFLASHTKRIGASGKEIQSNVSDPESAKIKGPHGVIQGYNGIAVADSHKQVIIAAEAFGSGSEGEHFPPMLDKLQHNLDLLPAKLKAGKEGESQETPTILGNTNYFSEDNLQYAQGKSFDALIPDQQFRKRDARFKERFRFGRKDRFDISRFSYDEKEDLYVCPHQKKLIFSGMTTLFNKEGKRYLAKAKDCACCPYLSRCVASRGGKYPRRTLIILSPRYEENLSHKMRNTIDQPECRELYARRMQIIEPVFANITYCKGMNRFTLRSKVKVNIQWLLYCIVHNIGKCAPCMGLP